MFLHLPFVLLLLTCSSVCFESGEGGGGGTEATQNCFGKSFLGLVGRDREIEHRNFFFQVYIFYILYSNRNSVFIINMFF